MRRPLVAQDKNKYNTPKHQLCVRTSDRDIIAQVIIAKIQGNVVLSSVYSHQLKIPGAVCGLQDYAVAYTLF